MQSPCQKELEPDGSSTHIQQLITNKIIDMPTTSF